MTLGSTLWSGRPPQEAAPFGDSSPEIRAGHLHLDASIVPVVRTGFDVDAFTRRGTERLPVDAAAIAAAPALPAEVRTALGVLQRLEASALAESRAMLATATAREARITAFLATWMVDRFWQARALRDLLEADVRAPASGRPGADPEEHHSRRPLHVLRRIHVDRVQPLLGPLWTALAAEEVPAGHMARLAIQEASLQVALRAVARRLGGEALRVVTTVADRHEESVAFFTAEARTRVLRSRREAAVARLVLSLDSPLDGGGIVDRDLAAAVAVIGADVRDRAALRTARREITRLLPGPDLPDPRLRDLPRPGE
ncbi:hypothetical protein [Brachybacterium sp. J153]|uniref:hypothetical protein n=1 Tax=Brachybacterium sp. J153 TaxID=3116488 RepID=UPI002E77B00C|nr:hypothetical protein [Brachybacterium sp. J153]MEE1619513.1 hypothetical protein [Brachybacterium sp. J153]